MAPLQLVHYDLPEHRKPIVCLWAADVLRLSLGEEHTPESHLKRGLERNPVGRNPWSEGPPKAGFDKETRTNVRATRQTKRSDNTYTYD